MAVIIRPSAAAAKVLPGEDLTLRFAVAKAPGDAAVSAFVLNDAGGIVLTSLETFREIRVPFTDAELAEFPPFPPSIRKQARREGRIELVSSARSGGEPIPVTPGESVVVTVEVSAVKKSSALLSGQLVLEGEVWGRNEIPIAALAGRGSVEAVPVPTRIDVNILPGAGEERDVTIFKAPVEATAVVVIDTASPHVRLARVMAFGTEQRFFTDDEILDLPPALRERARREGYTVDVLLSTVGPGEASFVPRGGMLKAFVALNPPEDGSAADLSGTLTIESTSWRRIDVPIAPLIGNVKVSLSADRVEVVQGEGAGVLIAHLESLAGPATDVRFGQWFPEHRWTISPASIHLPAGATQDVTLHFAAPVTTDPGSYRLDLKTSWFDDRSSLTFTLTLVVAPAPITVTPLQPRLSGQQGSRISCPVEIRSSGLKIVRFTAGLLPHGVTMPPPAQIGFQPGVHVLNLEFVIDPFASVWDYRMTVDWRSADGAGGTLELRLNVQLRLDERVFEQPVVTDDGVALGGSVRLLVRNDGTGIYSGHMRATGGLSYSFRIRSVIHSADGQMLVVGQESGSVHGTFDFGDREYRWTRAVDAFAARQRWPSVKNGAMIVNNAFQVGGLFGTLKDLVSDTIQFITARGLLSSVPGGQLISAIVFIGSELGDLAGLHNIAGPGGVPGVLLAGGAAFVMGPSWMVPVFVGAAIAGELTIQHRPLTGPEVEFADQVFAGSLDFDRIRITNLTGAGGRQFACPSHSDVVLVNLGQHIFDNPIGHAIPEYPVQGQVLIHELTHAWQIQHRSSSAEFLWNVLLQKIGADGDYTYGPPGPPWSEAFGLEAQASVVDEWFAGADKNAFVKMPGRKSMNVIDPYFRYIRDNIQAKRT